MKRFSKAIILFIILSLLLASCAADKPASGTAAAGTKEIKTASGEDMIIPCLTYHNASGKTAARLSYWNITKGTLEISEKEAYSFPENTSYRVPEVWDGKKKLIVLDYASLSGEYTATGKRAAILSPNTQEAIFGENIQVVKQRDPASGKLLKYSIKAWEGERELNAEVRFDYQYKDSKGASIPIDENGDVSAVSYRKGEAVFMFARTPGEGFSIFAVRYNMATGEQKWSEIKIPGDAMDFSTIPFPNTVDNMGDRFYCATPHGLGMIDLAEGKFTELNDIAAKCSSVVKTTRQSEFPRYFVIKGCYEDIAVFGVPVNTGAENENLYCAFRGSEYLGAIYVNGDTLSLMDKDNKVKSKTGIKENKLRTDIMFAFPRKNGNNCS